MIKHTHTTLLLLALSCLLGSCKKEYDDMHYLPISVECVDISAGCFTMGALSDEPGSYSDEGPAHDVVLTRNFAMSRFEITNAQFAAFLNAKRVSAAGIFELPPFGNKEIIINSDEMGGYHGVRFDSINNKWHAVSGKDNYPVVWVTWYGATAFAEWVGGSLPTEAQWEYACRSGNNTPFGVGEGSLLTGSMANISGYYPYSLTTGGEYIDPQGAYLEHTAAVGSYAPNSWGLYDMHGNVWEWCSDSYTLFSSSQQTDPTGGTSGKYRVLKGGSWSSNARHCRSSYRLACEPERYNSNIGFRVIFNQ